MYNISITLRLIEEVYEKIKKLAEEDKRSINAEINFILEEYIKKHESE